METLSKRGYSKSIKVQRRATKLITECRGLKYMDRLVETGLTSLADRRTRGDLIEFSK